MKALIEKINSFEVQFKQNNQSDALMPALEEIYETIKSNKFTKEELRKIYAKLDHLSELFDETKEHLRAEKISLLAKNNHLKRYIINSNVKTKK